MSPAPQRLRWQSQFGSWSVVCTDRSDGDFSPSSSGVRERRALVVGARPCLWLYQVHDVAAVWVREGALESLPFGAEADAAITSRSDVALSVVTADCAPIALLSEGVGAVVHAGWKGLLAGIVENTAAEIRAVVGRGAPLSAVLGPCIHPSAYAFGNELRALMNRYGETVRGRTGNGAAALDVPATVEAACARAGVALDTTLCQDTAQPNFFSHRTRQDPERQAMFLFRSAP